MLISNKIHYFRNFQIQIYKKISPLQTDGVRNGLNIELYVIIS